MTHNDLQAAWAALSREAQTLRDGARELPVATASRPAEVRADVEQQFPLDEPMPLPDLVRAAAGLLRRHAVHVIHPRYFGLFNPSVRDASALGDALAALYNPQLAVWAHAPAAAELERHALRRLASALGREGDAATFTTGGAEANLTAVLAALARLAPGWEEGGVRALPARPALYASVEAHHSFVKIARIVGLGAEALREVGVDERLRMDPEALDRRIADDRGKGFSPLLVVGTAGTTGAGIIDPLPALATVAAGAGAWFHVDAAYGGAAALVPRLRPDLEGIARADSVTWDAHKGLSVPMGAGMLFCRDAEALRRAFAVTTSYMPSAAADALSRHPPMVPPRHRAQGPLRARRNRSARRRRVVWDAQQFALPATRRSAASAVVRPNLEPLLNLKTILLLFPARCSCTPRMF
jgi:glutamate/tyrosine decarboxylase-like PLP-dependent enzyme